MGFFTMDYSMTDNNAGCSGCYTNNMTAGGDSGVKPMGGILPITPGVGATTDDYIVRVKYDDDTYSDQYVLSGLQTSTAVVFPTPGNSMSENNFGNLDVALDDVQTLQPGAPFIAYAPVSVGGSWDANINGGYALTWGQGDQYRQIEISWDDAKNPPVLPITTYIPYVWKMRICGPPITYTLVAVKVDTLGPSLCP